MISAGGTVSDLHLINQVNVLAGKIDEECERLEAWKKKALSAKIEECYEIIAASDRRVNQHRRVNSHGSR